MQNKQGNKRNILLSSFRKFLKTNNGYATALTLVSLPFILGLAAWTIDGARVVNLHTDLQQAADAMALAGARELDGRDDVIERANEAIELLIENEAVFADGGIGSGLGSIETVSFDPDSPANNSVQVEYLSEIPADDQTGIGPIPSEAATTNSNEAAYVRVVVIPKNVNTIFPLPGIGFDDIAVSAEATATFVASACNVTPIFICNPFELSDPDREVGDLFAEGRFYAREFRLVNNGANSPGPGNFGFLRINDEPGGGANLLRDALAIGRSGICFRREAIITEPGAQTGPVFQGINTRFGIYAGAAGNNELSDAAYRPDLNVRSGQSQGRTNGNGNGNGNNNGPSCSAYDPEADLSAIAFPTGTLDDSIEQSGGEFFMPDWDFDLYWEIAHGGLENPPAAEAEVDGSVGLFEIDEEGNFVPDGTATVTYIPPEADVVIQRLHQPAGTIDVPLVPSKYDTYLQEIREGLLDDASPNGETGQTQLMCHNDNVGAENRREIFVAIVNCNAANEDGLAGRTTLEAEAFARMFMTRPGESNGNNRFISLEMIDVSGNGGLGTVEEILREEAELVR